MSETTLGLFRHGQTDWNIDFRLQGTAEVPLNEFGIGQVQRAAAVLSQGDWDVLLTSPLGRAKASAEIIQRELGIAELIVDSMLLERSFGIGDGMLYSQWQEQYSQLEEIPGAESTASIIERSRELLASVVLKYAGARVLAVSHGALIRYVLSEVSQGQVPPPGQRLQNASLHTLRHSGQWTLDSWAPEPLGQ